MANTFKALSQSLYQKSFYREVAANKNSNPFLFLLLISFIQVVQISVILLVSAASIPNHLIDNLVNQTPVVTVQDGKLSIDKASPYKIIVDDEVLAIIDTENYNDKSADSIFKTMKDNNWQALVTQTKIYAKKSSGEFRVYDLSDNSGNRKIIKFDKNDVRQWAKIGVKIAIPFIAIFLFIGIFAYKIIQMFIYSVIALIINAVCNARLEYNSLMCFSAYALWPSLLAGIILSLAGINIWTLFSIIITAGYLIFAINSSKQPKS